jgi:hypothetical protein
VWPWSRSDQWPLEWSGQATGVAISQVRPMAIRMIWPSNRCGHEPGLTNGHWMMIGPSNRCGHEPGPTNGYWNDLTTERATSGLEPGLSNGHYIWCNWHLEEILATSLATL